jgi:hypothetical protein
MACQNAAQPLSLVWGNWTESYDSNALSRGISIGFGTPAQYISLRPTLNSNYTWIHDLSSCKSATNDSCIGYEGGVFTLKQSSTYHSTTENHWNGTDGTDLDATFTFSNDNINLGYGPIPGFPFVIDPNSYDYCESLKRS